MRYAIDTGINVQDRRWQRRKRRQHQHDHVRRAADHRAAVARGIFQFWQTYTGEWVSQKVAYDIRNEIYDHLQRLSFAYHDKAQTGQIMPRATQDVEGIRMFVTMGVIRLVYVIILLVATLTLMLRVDWQLALLSWAFIPPTGDPRILMTTKLRPIWMQVQNLAGPTRRRAAGEPHRHARRQGVRPRDFESGSSTQRRPNLFTNSYATNKIQATYSPLLNGVWALAMVATAWFGAREILHGQLTTGELAQFMLYLTMLQLPVRSIGWVNMFWARAATSGERIYEILDAESAVQENARRERTRRRPGPRPLRGRLASATTPSALSCATSTSTPSPARSSPCSDRPAAARPPSST